jgi:hypothetical protein
MQKKLSILLVLIPLAFRTYSQSKQEVLDSKVNEFSIEKIKLLQDSGVLSDLDIEFLGMYLLKLAGQHAAIDTLTYGQLIQNFRNDQLQQDKERAKLVHFGQDSVFFRSPSGDKLFLGMGELSLEKLVERESKNLPVDYKDAFLDQLLSPVTMPEFMSKFPDESELPVFIGNTFLILMEQGKNLLEYKLGDLQEIATRVMNSKEIQPFINYMKMN